MKDRMKQYLKAVPVFIVVIVCIHVTDYWWFRDKFQREFTSGWTNAGVQIAIDLVWLLVGPVIYVHVKQFMQRKIRKTKHGGVPS